MPSGALLDQLEAGQDKLSRRLVCITPEDKTVILHGRETLYRNGERVGWLSSAGYGHFLQTPIGFAYVRNAAGVSNRYLSEGSYQLEVAGELFACTVSLRPLLKLPNI